VGKRPRKVISAGDRPPQDTIVQAALETIASDTISGTRMREIAKRSAISQGHLHYYFSAKSLLFLAVLDHLQETFAVDRRAALDDASLPLRDKLYVFFQQQTHLIRYCTNLLTVRLDFLIQGTRDAAIEAKVREMYANWHHDIAEVVLDGVVAGVFSPDYAPLIPNLLIALMEGAFLQYLNEPESIELEEYFQAAHGMVVGLLQTTGSAAVAGIAETWESAD